MVNPIDDTKVLLKSLYERNNLVWNKKNNSIEEVYEKGAGGRIKALFHSMTSRNLISGQKARIACENECTNKMSELATKIRNNSIDINNIKNKKQDTIFRDIEQMYDKISALNKDVNAIKDIADQAKEFILHKKEKYSGKSIGSHNHKEYGSVSSLDQYLSKIFSSKALEQEKKSEGIFKFLEKTTTENKINLSEDLENQMTVFESLNKLVQLLKNPNDNVLDLTKVVVDLKKNQFYGFSNLNDAIIDSIQKNDLLKKNPAAKPLFEALGIKQPETPPQPPIPSAPIASKAPLTPSSPLQALTNLITNLLTPATTSEITTHEAPPPVSLQELQSTLETLINSPVGSISAKAKECLASLSKLPSPEATGGDIESIFSKQTFGSLLKELGNRIQPSNATITRYADQLCGEAAQLMEDVLDRAASLPELKEISPQEIKAGVALLSEMQAKIIKTQERWLKLSPTYPESFDNVLQVLKNAINTLKFHEKLITIDELLQEAAGVRVSKPDHEAGKSAFIALAEISEEYTIFGEAEAIRDDMARELNACWQLLDSPPSPLTQQWYDEVAQKIDHFLDASAKYTIGGDDGVKFNECRKNLKKYVKDLKNASAFEVKKRDFSSVDAKLLQGVEALSKGEGRTLEEVKQMNTKVFTDLVKILRQPIASETITSTKLELRLNLMKLVESRFGQFETRETLIAREDLRASIVHYNAVLQAMKLLQGEQDVISSECQASQQYDQEGSQIAQNMISGLISANIESLKTSLESPQDLSKLLNILNKANKLRELPAKLKGFGVENSVSAIDDLINSIHQQLISVAKQKAQPMDLINGLNTFQTLRQQGVEIPEDILKNHIEKELNNPHLSFSAKANMLKECLTKQLFPEHLAIYSEKYARGAEMLAQLDQSMNQRNFQDVLNIMQKDIMDLPPGFVPELKEKINAFMEKLTHNPAKFPDELTQTENFLTVLLKTVSSQDYPEVHVSATKLYSQIEGSKLSLRSLEVILNKMNDAKSNLEKVRAAQSFCREMTYQSQVFSNFSDLSSGIVSQVKANLKLVQQEIVASVQTDSSVITLKESLLAAQVLAETQRTLGNRAELEDLEKSITQIEQQINQKRQKLNENIILFSNDLKILEQEKQTVSSNSKVQQINSLYQSSLDKEGLLPGKIPVQGISSEDDPLNVLQDPKLQQFQAIQAESLNSQLKVFQVEETDLSKKISVLKKREQQLIADKTDDQRVEKLIKQSFEPTYRFPENVRDIHAWEKLYQEKLVAWEQSQPIFTRGVALFNTIGTSLNTLIGTVKEQSPGIAQLRTLKQQAQFTEPSIELITIAEVIDRLRIIQNEDIERNSELLRIQRSLTESLENQTEVNNKIANIKQELDRAKLLKNAIDMAGQHQIEINTHQESLKDLDVRERQASSRKAEVEAESKVLTEAMTIVLQIKTIVSS